MTAQEIEIMLSAIPSELKDVHPEQMENYFSTTYSELSNNDVKLLTAHYAYRNFPKEQTWKVWDNGFRPSVIARYSSTSTYDISTDLLPWIRLIHAQGNSGITVVGVEN